MIFEYYPETDMLHIRLTEGTSAESEEVAPGIVLDFDEHHRVTGVEIEDASMRSLPVGNLILSERVPTGM